MTHTLLDIQGNAAVIGGQGLCYRYRLTRVWEPEKPRLLAIGYSPSYGDAKRDDPPTRRLCEIAGQFDFGGLEYLCLFAYRKVQAFMVLRQDNPIGGDNAHWMRKSLRGALAAHNSATVLCCWGDCGEPEHPVLLRAKEQVLQVFDLSRVTVKAIDLTPGGNPIRPRAMPRGDTLRDYSLS